MIFDYLVNFLVHIMPYAHLHYFIGFAFFFLFNYQYRPSRLCTWIFFFFGVAKTLTQSRSFLVFHLNNCQAFLYWLCYISFRLTCIDFIHSFLNESKIQTNIPFWHYTVVFALNRARDAGGVFFFGDNLIVRGWGI